MNHNQKQSSELGLKELVDRYRLIQKQVIQTCERVGRDPKSVQLLAVSKFQPASFIEVLYQEGQRAFAENYAQEFSEKAASLQNKAAEIKWHFIGSLQRNKIKLLAGNICLLQTVDRVSLLSAFSSYIKTHSLPPQDCLVEVNLGGEEQKSGCVEQQVPQLLEAFAKEEGRVRCKGLMCIPPYHKDPEYSRSFFQRLYQVQQKLKEKLIPYVDLKELSMGMSADFPIAIEEGATIIRVGTALFGPRH